MFRPTGSEGGAGLESSVIENIMINCDPEMFSKKGIIHRHKARRLAEKMIDEYGINAKPDSTIGTLSGGNIQKVILARELKLADDIVLFSEPAWGLDLASSSYIYKKILEVKAGGGAVILITSNIDEIIKLTDRVLVLYRGKAAVLLKTEDTDQRVLGEYMLGLNV